MADTTPTKSIVLSDTEVTGTLNFKGELNFAGNLIKGSITGGTLIVASSSSINGNIMADVIRVEGTVLGNITAMVKCEMGGSARITGDLSSPSIVMAEGATLIGQMRIGPGAQTLNPTTPMMI